MHCGIAQQTRTRRTLHPATRRILTPQERVADAAALQPHPPPAHPPTHTPPRTQVPQHAQDLDLQERVADAADVVLCGRAARLQQPPQQLAQRRHVVAVARHGGGVQLNDLSTAAEAGGRRRRRVQSQHSLSGGVTCHRLVAPLAPANECACFNLKSLRGRAAQLHPWPAAGAAARRCSPLALLSRW